MMPGHASRALTVGTGAAVIYLLAIALIFARIAANAMLGHPMTFWILVAILWCSGFAGFILPYGWFPIGPSKWQTQCDQASGKIQHD